MDKHIPEKQGLGAEGVGRWRDPGAVMDVGPAEMLPEGRAK